MKIFYYILVYRVPNFGTYPWRVFRLKIVDLKNIFRQFILTARVGERDANDFSWQSSVIEMLVYLFYYY